jgi:hypothetical protein
MLTFTHSKGAVKGKAPAAYLAVSLGGRKLLIGRRRTRMLTHGHWRSKAQDL